MVIFGFERLVVFLFHLTDWTSTWGYGLTMEGYGSGMDIADFSSAQVAPVPKNTIRWTVEGWGSTSSSGEKT